MTLWFVRWLQRNTIQAAGGIAATTGNDVIAPPLCKEFAPFRGELATTALRVEHQQNDRRANVLCTLSRAPVLNHGGRERLKGTPSRRKTGQMASAQTHRGRNA